MTSPFLFYFRHFQSRGGPAIVKYNKGSQDSMDEFMLWRLAGQGQGGRAARELLVSPPEQNAWSRDQAAGGQPRARRDGKCHL